MVGYASSSMIAQDGLACMPSRIPEFAARFAASGHASCTGYGDAKFARGSGGITTRSAATAIWRSATPTVQSSR